MRDLLRQARNRVRALRDWVHTGLYREQPFHQFGRREKRRKQAEDKGNQFTLFD